MKINKKMGISYDTIIQEIQIVCDRSCLEPEKKKKIDELCRFFDSTSIKSLAPNLEFLFPTSPWKQRDAAVSGIAQTTNAVKGWHFRSQS